jgi:hypothetical protein
VRAVEVAALAESVTERTTGVSVTFVTPVPVPEIAIGTVANESDCIPLALSERLGVTVANESDCVPVAVSGIAAS